MASVEQCERAFQQLAARLAGPDARSDAARHAAGFERTISCALRAPDVIFAGHLRDGRLEDIRQVDSTDAQIRLSMSGDDLVALVAGELGVGAAWTSGRLDVKATMLDLLKLRSIL